MTAPVAGRLCEKCGSQLAPSLLACPACGALVHAGELKRFAGRAESAAAMGDISRALESWREALALLPASSQQHDVVAARIEALSNELTKASPVARAERAKKRSWLGGGAAAVGAVVIFALSKAKLLLLGLTKLSTMGSMLLFLLVYLQMFGWKFALGFVLSIYVHEMGHVASLRHFGIPASAPMFIPGIGAFVRLNRHPATAAEDARVGLAGPVWGVAAALVCWAAWAITGAPIWQALAHAGAWINLFNLLPVWQLDGGRGMTALNRAQRWMLVVAIAAGFAWSRDNWFVIVGIGAIWQAFRHAPEKPDWGVLGTFVGLIVTLAVIIAATQGGAGPL